MINYKFDDIDNEKYLTFIINDKVFAVKSKFIVEIMSVVPISEIPGFPEYLMGVVNLRGKIIPIIDLQLKFKIDNKSTNRFSCFVILQNDDVQVGIIVDRVNDVVDIDEDLIIEPPEPKTGYIGSYISGIDIADTKIKQIIDVEKLLSSCEWKDQEVVV